MKKTLNRKLFKYLDAYDDEAYDWATKEYNKIKDKKEITKLDIDVISATFVCIYSDFLHISMGYADGTTIYMLEDFYEKTGNVEKEIDMLLNCKNIIFNEMCKACIIAGTDPEITIYSKLISSVKRTEEDEYGDIVTIDPINAEANSHQKHQEVMNFVIAGFN